MRKVAIIAAAGLLVLAGSALAANLATDEASTGGSGGAGVRSNDCPDGIVFDIGMTDNFTPPSGCSSAGSINCWEVAEGDPLVWELYSGDEFYSNGETLTGFKIWLRYNAQGYNSGRRVDGFCVKIYEAPVAGVCPDGISTDPLGTLISEQYVGAGSFVENEIIGFLPRNFNECLTLPTPVPTVAGNQYWVIFAADYDYVDTGDGVLTRAFLRYTNQGIGFSDCEAVIAGVDLTDPNNPIWDPWTPISVAFALPCWAGWDVGLVVYGHMPPPTGACCYQDGTCAVTAQAECFGVYQGDGSSCDPNPCPQPPKTGACCFNDGSCQVLTAVECQGTNGQYYGDDSVCDPNPCPPPVPVQKSTWGQVKNTLGN